MPFDRYRDVHDRVPIALTHTEREWPTKRLTEAPLWVPVDLRDGNQSLAEPMDPLRKRRMFDLMVAMGYKEIEVGYPSASQTDFDFVREIAEQGFAPHDVTIGVFTAARTELLDRTIESIEGITNPVIIHMYTATAPAWRDTVLTMEKPELKAFILAGAQYTRDRTRHLPNVRFEFSPEVFNLTEPDFALEVCDGITEIWDATPERTVIINLTATVEASMPNVFADQVEYMHKHLARRDGVILSVHPHNDRGTGVASAELGLLAGAQRVEGCLFGNGERTGNVDIATMALNLHTQGIDPMIDFSDIDEIRRTVEYCNRLEVHPRHPYVGDLVHTAFSGTHQDAIKKGFTAHRAQSIGAQRDEREIAWNVPYLPIDPADIGRSYDAVIRVNSQSGKGGMAYLLESEYGIELPRRLQIDFSKHVQRHTDDTGAEVTSHELWTIFERSYLTSPSDSPRISLTHYETAEDAAHTHTHVTITLDGTVSTTEHTHGGPIEALTSALADRGISIEVLDLHQTSMRSGNDSEALTLIEYRSGTTIGWAAGRDESVLSASMAAIIQAANILVGETSRAPLVSQ